VSHQLRSRVVGCLLAVAVGAIAFAPAANAASTDPVIQAPEAGGTYLALGDSLAFGYQAVKVNACAATGCTNPDSIFNTGYVDDYAASFGVSGVNTVNLGCPGETSSTLLNATNATTGCTTYPFAIHSNHPGETQIQAAVDVLRSIGKKVSPITIDIGANDVLGAVRGCTDSTTGAISLTCVQGAAPAVFATINSNLDSALNTLRQEGGVKHEIIVVGLYNVLYPAIFQQTLIQTGSLAAAAAAGAASDQLAIQLNALQAATAAKYRAVFADPFPVFNPQGNPSAEIASICTKTAVCGPLHDIHPTDSGYAALAGVVGAADGF
jgi:lysophospholipase L1-like esterase